MFIFIEGYLLTKSDKGGIIQTVLNELVQI